MRTRKERPLELEGKTTKIATGLGTLFVTISMHEDKPFEMLATISKSGRDVNAMTEAIGRLISLWLRSDGDIESLVEQLKGIGGETPLASGKGIVRSIPDAIAQLLEKRFCNKEEK